MRVFVAVCCAVLLGTACASADRNIGNGSGPTAGNGGAGAGLGVNGVAVLLHQPVWKYSGCAAAGFIKAYNLDQSFAGASQKNADLLESTDNQPTQASACGATTNQSACPTGQTPLAGNEACTPIVYLSATNAGEGAGCNGHSFYTTNGTTNADFYHATSPTNTNVNYASNGPVATVSGSPATGQTNTVTINGQATNESQTTGNTTAQEATAIAAAINANANINTVVSASASGSNVFVVPLTAATSTFTVSSSGGDTLTASGYCTNTGALIIIPDTTDWYTWLGSANADNPFKGAPANQGYFKDDTYLGLVSNNCSVNLLGFISQGTVSEVTTDAQAEQHMANMVNHFSTSNFYSNDIGGGGFGCSSVPQAPISTLYSLQTSSNDRGAVAEQCLNASSNGTNQEAGCFLVINTCSQILTSFPERCIILNNRQPNAGGALGLRRAHRALIWILNAIEAGVGSASWYKIVSWLDPDGGTTNAASEIWPEDMIWTDPRTLVLPSGQSTIRKFVYGGSSVNGSGCPSLLSDVGGAADALIPGTCGTSSNNKPGGVYAAYYGTCFYKGAAGIIGHCMAVLNTTTSAVSITCCAGGTMLNFAGVASWNQITMNVGASTVGELQNAIGGTLTCTDCDGTLSSSGAVSFPFSLPAGDAMLLVTGSFTTI